MPLPVHHLTGFKQQVMGVSRNFQNAIPYKNYYWTMDIAEPSVKKSYIYNKVNYVPHTYLKSNNNSTTCFELNEKQLKRP